MSTQANAIVSTMLLPEKVGQMFMIGWHGQTVTDELCELFRTCHFGGVNLLPRNLADAFQTAVLTRELQDAARSSGQTLPLWLAADQEGGAILAVREGATPFPGNMGLGACRDTALTYQVAQAIAAEASGMGINMNYAPVLDVNSNPRNPIIGVRSFGEDPDCVARLGNAFVRGTMDAGVLPVGKHFPGHGDTLIDSHLGLPVVDSTLETMLGRELIPFRHAIMAGLPAIMTSHIVFKALDPNCPATLSHSVLTGLLREKMGFGGLVLTDDLEMEAIAGNYAAEEFAVQAILAGADMLLISHSAARQAGAAHAIMDAVRRGLITEKRIDESVRRIVAAKLKWAKSSTGKLPGHWDETRRAHTGLERRVCQDMITVVRDDDGRLPLSPGSQPTVVLWPQVQSRARVDDPGDVCPLGAAVRQYCSNVSEINFSLAPDEAEIAQVCNRITENGSTPEALIVATSTSRPGEREAQGRLIRRLLGLGIPTTVASLRNPYDISEFPECRTYLAAYSYQPAAVEALAGAMYGAFRPVGAAPVSLEEKVGR